MRVVASRKIVRPLSEMRIQTPRVHSLEELLSRAEELLRSTSQATRKDTLLIFGLPGVGKTTLAVALARKLADSLSGYRGFFIDSEIGRLIPKVTGKKARELLGPQAEGLELLELSRHRRWILVVDNIDSLSDAKAESALGYLRSRIAMLLDDDEASVLLIGTCREPSKIDPAILSWFGKRTYLPPWPINEVSPWLVMGGIGLELATRVTDEFVRLGEKLDFAYIAPEKLFTDVKSGSARITTDVHAEPRDIALTLSSSSADIFVDRNRKTIYEKENAGFIRQSTYLEDLTPSKFETG